MDDLISRRAAIKAIDDLPNCYNGYSDTYDKAYIIGTLEEVPPIEPKRGKWIDGHYSGFDGCRVWHRECSLCRYERDDDDPEKDTNYCPNCGALMKGESEE